MEEKLKLTKMIEWLSFLVPLFGLMVLAIHCAESPKAASRCGKLAIYGVSLLAVLALLAPWIIRGLH